MTSAKTNIKNPTAKYKYFLKYLFLFLVETNKKEHINANTGI